MDGLCVFIAGADLVMSWPFASHCLLIVNKFVEAMDVAPDVVLSDQTLTVLTKNASPHNGLWQSSHGYRSALSVELARLVGRSFLWTRNPLITPGMRCMATMVVNADGQLVSNTATFDPAVMCPIYFMQGSTCGHKDLDGLQQLLYRIYHQRGAYCIPVSHLLLRFYEIHFVVTHQG